MLVCEGLEVTVSKDGEVGVGEGVAEIMVTGDGVKLAVGVWVEVGVDV